MTFKKFVWLNLIPYSHLPVCVCLGGGEVGGKRTLCLIVDFDTKLNSRNFLESFYSLDKVKLSIDFRDILYHASIEFLMPSKPTNLGLYFFLSKNGYCSKTQNRQLL